MIRPLLRLFAALAGAAVLLLVLGTRALGLPPLGTLLDPIDGLYRTARQAPHPAQDRLALPDLENPVTVVRDDRGVPHLFAASDRDAIIALGYVVAQDRLFQMDFIPRVAAGRLAAALGPDAVEADRFLRRTGMDWGARRNAERIAQEGGLERDVIDWYTAGVNAYIDGLEEKNLPFEFRLLGYRPERYSALQVIRLLQYMTYDLTYRTDHVDYKALRERLGEAAFELLYPRSSRLFVPIVPEQGGRVPADRPVYGNLPEQSTWRPAPAGLWARLRQQLAGTVAEGFREGKGSNNWAVSGARSATGAPLLAGDMHLSLTLPAIWYEVHLVTPEMNTYGVTVPGAPLPVEAFNTHVGWTFTNTGVDQIDHLALELDAARTRYRFEGAWRPLEAVIDTIWVKDAEPVLDTLYYAHWGPVTIEDDRATALQWVAHHPSRTLQALWGMNRARGYAAFEDALRCWDAPMQNILYADVHGNIAIRSTGYLPVRRAGHGVGLLDGSTDAFAWVGRVPFEELPHSLNPPQGYLSSTNQQPADADYPHYLGHDWRSGYRSLRIDTLLRRQVRHTVADMKRYQADVHAVQRDLFVPLIDTLQGLSARADTLRQLLARWDGTTSVDRPEPLVLDEFLAVLADMTWDEPVFQGLKRPGEAQLLYLLREAPQSKWLDVQGTPVREDARALLRQALEATASRLDLRYGWDAAQWRWGDHHRIVFKHLTGSEALRPLWRGPFEYPGFSETLSPARDRLTTHSASWRVVVDFSQSPPQGYGVYPGGQSGNPFSVLYDLHLPAYVGFEHYKLLNPAAPDELAETHVSSRLTLLPEKR